MWTRSFERSSKLRSNMLKVGDKLYCYKLEPFHNYLTIGEVYTIIKFSGDVENENRLWIINNNHHDEDWYYINDIGIYYYKNYFYTLREVRKMKLDLLR